MYVFKAHARPGATRVPTTTDPRHHTHQRVDGRDAQAGAPSLAGLPRDHAVLMEACSSAGPPGVVRTRRGIDDTFVPDPLAVVSESQHVANETGRTAYGGTDMVSFATLPDGTFVHRLYTDSRGRRGQWVEHRPEPAGEPLDDRARAAGLHTDPDSGSGDGRHPRTDPAAGPRAAPGLRRGVLEDDSRYGDLLAGIGALETMRAAARPCAASARSPWTVERAAHARRPATPVPTPTGTCSAMPPTPYAGGRAPSSPTSSPCPTSPPPRSGWAA